VGGGLKLAPDEAQEWHDVGAWHDALRDADRPELPPLGRRCGLAVTVLHGPAAARLASEVRANRTCWRRSLAHVRRPAWARTGRALFAADFLEPGRPFARAEREFLARALPRDFDGVFRQVVQLRLEWTLREGKPVFPETAALWNQVL
jgi:2-amino-4-hydroxy-6-hydroxymethyldihydropteridine diphosphokinase